MKQLRALAVAVAICMLGASPQAFAQISPSASWSCEFTNSATDCGFSLQAAASSRATNAGPGVDVPTAAVLTTQPGDANIAGSGGAERADLSLGPSSSYCNQGQEEWWAHSVMFPSSYVMPPQSVGWNWGVVFDFHHTGSTGQPNFEIASIPGGLELNVAGGASIVNLQTDPGYYSVSIGAVTPNVWYDFLYHIKWSWGSDGLFQAWLNGQQVMNYSGPTLYVGESCYLKLANYHTPLGMSESVIHSRIVRGPTQASVQMPSGSPPPPPVSVSVAPATASLQTGATQDFTGTVANTTNAMVTWQVNGVAGGNSAVGVISTSGVYSAPSTVPSPATVTVTAVSSADPTRSASAQVTITAPGNAGPPDPTPAPGISGGAGGGGSVDPVALLACALALVYRASVRRRVANAILVLGAPLVAQDVSAQVTPSNTIPSTAAWSCEFPTSATDCGFSLQAAAATRATNAGPGVDVPTAAVLTTQPGDANIAGSGGAERVDLSLGPSTSYCNQGQDEWWAHSVMFPPSYVMPPQTAGWNWGVVFDFHHTRSTGQPNFEVASIPGGLELNVAGGPTVVNLTTDPGYYSVSIGPVTPNVWYNFMYHVKWSSGSDGVFQAWLNGQQVMNFTGPTLYTGQSCYLKLANYHTPLGVSESVVHSRVVFGHSQADVAFTSSGGGSPPPAPKKDPVYDFSGSGMSDILWRNSSTGQNVLWLMNGATVSSAPALTTSARSWGVAGAGDFSGSGKAAILWRNRSTGQNQIWFMNGGTVTGTANLPTVADQSWTVAGVGDFDGDGKADILWRNKSTGQNQIWFMNGGAIATAANITTVADQNWTVAGVGDFDGDGKADIAWHNTADGQNQIWLMNGGSVASSAAILTVSDLSWRVVGVGDFDGDGKADILWRDSSTGQNAILFMSGTTVLNITYVTSVTDLNWSVASVGDYDGDGKADILWRNGSTGQNAIYFMNGGSVTSTSYLPNEAIAGWSVALH